MTLKNEIRAIARKMKAEHGSVTEIKGGENLEPIITFADGYILNTPAHSGDVDLSIFTYGYSGTGPDCFYKFLVAAGFSISYEKITTMEEGEVISGLREVTSDERSKKKPEDVATANIATLQDDVLRLRIPSLNRTVLSVLPEPFEWCAIPAGLVTLADRSVNLNRNFNVQPLFMAKYLITFEQFQVFVDDTQGYQNPIWWKGLDANSKARTLQPQGKDHTTNLPRDNVNWFEAVAFCRWLSECTSENIRLPTEWEWQWAAQGPGGLVYPYGNVFDSSKCNAAESGIGKTTPVTQYPQGASPYGLLDMSGNVWEWCQNKYDTPEDIDLAGDSERALRGGSWLEDDDFMGCMDTSYRFSCNPAYRNDFQYSGFRLCCDLPSQ